MVEDFDERGIEPLKQHNTSKTDKVRSIITNLESQGEKVELRTLDYSKKVSKSKLQSHTVKRYKLDIYHKPVLIAVEFE